jgi:hypothetical protein
MTKFAKFRKKPVVIEAMQYAGPDDAFSLGLFSAFADKDTFKWDDLGVLHVKTLEGEHIANRGDWIIKGVKGEFYPCKPDIFLMTYESAE